MRNTIFVTSPITRSLWLLSAFTWAEYWPPVFWKVPDFRRIVAWGGGRTELIIKRNHT
jgi:hypothetical protein